MANPETPMTAGGQRRVFFGSKFFVEGLNYRASDDFPPSNDSIRRWRPVLVSRGPCGASAAQNQSHAAVFPAKINRGPSQQRRAIDSLTFSTPDMFAPEISERPPTCLVD
jgi:hypothetical protein